MNLRNGYKDRLSQIILSIFILYIFKNFICIQIIRITIKIIPHMNSFQ